jgi:hypothetical protein
VVRQRAQRERAPILVCSYRGDVDFAYKPGLDLGIRTPSEKKSVSAVSRGLTKGMAGGSSGSRLVVMEASSHPHLKLLKLRRDPNHHDGNN